MGKAQSTAAPGELFLNRTLALPAAAVPLAALPCFEMQQKRAARPAWSSGSRWTRVGFRSVVGMRQHRTPVTGQPATGRLGLGLARHRAVSTVAAPLGLHFSDQVVDLCRAPRGRGGGLPPPLHPANGDWRTHLVTAFDKVNAVKIGNFSRSGPSPKQGEIHTSQATSVRK